MNMEKDKDMLGDMRRFDRWKRMWLCGAGAVAIGALLPAAPAAAQAPAAQTATVKVALVVPLSGPWARQGDLMQKGAVMAVDDINRAGGVKALGGARVTLVVADAGETAEKAKNAAQRLIAQEPDLVGGSGAWLSSFTLAITEVTERAGLPWLTLSYSDQITERGFRYVFQTSPTGSQLSEGALPAILSLAQEAQNGAQGGASGGRPTSTAVLADNTAALASFTKPLREGGFARMGLTVPVDETFTPPLSDATAMVQRVRRAKPDFLLMLASNVPDDKLLLEKLNEFNLARGRLPVIATGAHMGAPDLLKVVDQDLLEGVMTIVGNWGAKGQEDLIRRFRDATGEPWLTQDSISTYGEMWILKEAMEQAGSADREKVAQALRGMDVTGGPAAFFPGGRVKFDAKGRRVGASPMIVQWQKGEPVAVWPQEAARAKAYWAKQ